MNKNIKQCIKISILIAIFLALFGVSSVFWNSWDTWVLSGITIEKIRNWDIHIGDIPKIIKWAIDFFMWIAWVIAVTFVIIWAYQILFIWAIEQNKTKWKETIMMALIWFAIAGLSWSIIRFIIDNFN